MACSKMVGLDVRPVISPSATMRASRPDTSSARWMLSCHGDWRSFCSSTSGLDAGAAAAFCLTLLIWPLLIRFSSPRQQAERALGDVLGREAEGLHDVRTRS